MLSIPRIKICGLTQPSDLEYLAQSGVDTVGINLVATSRRFVDLGRAKELAELAKALGLQTAAVLMNPTARQITDVASLIDWDFLQLHGSEEPEIAQHCQGLPIIKAVSCSGRPGEFDLAKRWLESFDPSPRSEAASLGPRAISTLACLLVDAYAPVHGGGTGQLARWDLLWPRPPEIDGVPMILAGGLTPDNVCSAIIQTRCDGVDTASGVESSPGRKCLALVAGFAQQSQAGFSSTAQNSNQ
jgi:phosphoribosylanthranilate isomerase